MEKKINKVMLINPSNTMPKDSIRRLATPLGFLYVGAVLKEKGYEVNILDSTCKGYFNTKIKGDYVTYGLDDEDIIKNIESYEPDIVGITSMFSAHQENALHHCDLVKKVNRNTPVVLGGIHPSLLPEETIKHKSVDYVLVGEGEYSFLELLENPKSKQIYYSEKISDLDSIPLPARELIDMEDYINIGAPYAPFPRKERTAQILTSRGCPFNCVFCSTKGYWGREFRARSVGNIIEEVEELVDNYGIEELQFSDDNMTVDKNRANELFTRLKDYDLSWCTPHGLMMKTVDEKMIKLMAESGAYQLTFAIESGSRRVLKEIIHKPVPPKNHVKHLLDVCHDHDIQVHGLFVTGFPGERREEIEQTLKYPFDVGFDSASYFIANPLPGSELYEQCKQKGYLKKHGTMDFKSAEIIIPKNSPDYIMPRRELEKLVDDKTREFNEYSKSKHPERWNKKFKKFLEKHNGESDIEGRVT
jgi:radical SAM superfamily enzyme YgiQ (UPF0313 family)